MLDNASLEALVLDCIRTASQADGRTSGLTLDTHLFDTAVLDSIGTLTFLSALEQATGVRLGDDEVFSDAFSTPRGIVGLMTAHLERR